MNFSNASAQARIKRAIEFTKHQPANLLQIAAEIGTTPKTTSHYIRHMRACGALEIVGKAHRTVLFKSTGVYFPEMQDRTAEHPVRSAPFVKPFRCAWTSLFFGPATDSRQAAG